MNTSACRSIQLLLGLFLLQTLTVIADEQLGLCCLCDGCGPPLHDRRELNIDTSGKTCNELSIEMADPTNGSRPGNGPCQTLQRRHYDRCCNPDHIIEEIPLAPTPAPRNPYPPGPHPQCHLCRNQNFPGNPNHLVAVLDHPDPDTCKDLYWYALAGQLNDQMCNPAQNYFYEPCDCEGGTSIGGGDGQQDDGESWAGLKALLKFIQWLLDLLD